MTDLVLREGEQAALRDVVAAEPLPGSALPGESALPALARLLACDASGIALLDATGGVEDSSAAGATERGDPVAAGPLVGIHQRSRQRSPDGSAGARGLAVLSLGVRNGPDHVVKLWMVRDSTDFSDRDRAMLALVAPALERLMRERPAAALPPSLTLQERRVLRHVAAGLTNAEIAERLFVERCTVRKHLENAYRKLGVTNRLAAVFAIEDGPRTGHGPDDATERAAALTGSPV